MRILFLGNLFPAPWDPTRGTFNLSTIQALSTHAEVRVVAPWGWWTRLRRTSELFSAPASSFTGFPAIYPTYWSVPRFQGLHGKAMARSLKGTLKKIHAEWPFDAILAAFAYPDGVAAAHLAKEFNVPLITAVLGSDVNEMPNNPALKEQIVWGLKSASQVVSVSGALKKRCAEIGVPEDQVTVQFNGVDGEQFYIRDKQALRAKLGLPTNRPIVCYVGNFKPEKGVDVIIDAASKLRQVVPDVQLSMVGSGPMQEQMDRRVSELNLASTVVFHGRQPHNAIPEWIGACDLFCLPSRREGCPNVVLEALASGRPVVASAVGGIPELLSHNNGLMAPAGDAEVLAQQLQAALTGNWDPDALRASVPCLSWSEVGETYARLFRSSLGAGERIKN